MDHEIKISLSYMARPYHIIVLIKETYKRVSNNLVLVWLVINFIIQSPEKEF